MYITVMYIYKVEFFCAGERREGKIDLYCDAVDLGNAYGPLDTTRDHSWAETRIVPVQAGGRVQRVVHLPCLLQT